MRVDLLIKDIIHDSCASLFEIDSSEVHIEHPLNKSWGDYSTNVAMITAKKMVKSPILLAKEIVTHILEDKRSTDLFEKVEMAGPGFINFTLSKKFLLSEMLTVLEESDDYGKCNIGEGQRIALEHSNVNPNKAAHIGHLRNAVIGQFLERVYEYMGYDVNVQYYCNDLGVQVSTSLLGMEKLSGVIKEVDYKKYDHFAWDVYAKISQMLTEDDDLQKELGDLVLKIDNRDPSISRGQEELAKRILQDNLETFSRLDVDYDLIVYESSIKDMHMWDITFNMLKSNPNVYLAEGGPSKGCWLVRMGDRKSSAEVEEDKIIVRSNGIPTYTGKDIAYHMWKYGLIGVNFKYQQILKNPNIHQNKPIYETTSDGLLNSVFSNANMCIDVIDVKQTYAISTVKKAMEYLGYKTQADNIIHVNYGHVYISVETARKMGMRLVEAEHGKVAMSGRKGIGVKIDDFICMVEDALVKEYGAFPNVVEVRNSAIKYDMLRYDTFQDVVFDVDDSLNTHGYSGTYVEYTHARACSLLDKATDSKEVIDKNIYDILNAVDNLPGSSMKVLRALYMFPEILVESATKYAPNLLCLYLYEVCQTFNSFYNDSPVLNEQDKRIREFKILLTDAVRQVLKNGLYLLGIKAVDKM